jgi:hypothetical protein
VNLCRSSSLAKYATIILGLTWFSFLYRGLPIASMWTFGDLLPFPQSYDQTLRAFVIVWQSQSLGNAIPRTPLLLVWGILQFLLGNNGILAQKVFYLSLLPLSMATMYRLLSQNLKSHIAPIIGAFLYVANPVVNGEFDGGAAGLLFCYALLPLIAGFAINVARRPQRVSSWVILSFVLLLLGWTSPQLLPLSVAMILTIWLFMWRHSGTHISFRPLLPRVGYLLSGFVLLYVWFLFGTPLGVALGSLPVQSLLGQVTINYSQNNVETTLRLGYWSFLLQPLGYAGLTTRNLLGLALPILCFSGFLARSTSKPLFYAFSALSLALLAFISLTQAGILNPLFILVPTLFIYRGPTMPLYLLSLSYSVLAAFSFDGWTSTTLVRQRIRNSTSGNHNSELDPPNARFPVKRIIKTILLAGLVLSSLVYVSPMLDGTIGLQATRNDQITVGQSLSAVAAWINEARASDGFFRTLWVPITAQEYSALSWLDPDIFALPLGADVYGYPNYDLIINTLDLLCGDSTNSIGVLLGEASVKYVILNTNSSSEGDCSANGGLPAGNPALFKVLLADQNDLRPITTISGFVIYLNLDFLPRVTVTTAATALLDAQSNPNSTTPVRISANLLSNPGLLNNASDWNLWLGTLISFQSQNNATSATATLTRPTSNPFPSSWVPELWQVLPVDAGEQYEVGVQTRAYDTSSAHVQISWFEYANRSFLVGTTGLNISPVTSVQLQTWSLVSGVFLAPKHARFLLVELLDGFSDNGYSSSIVSYMNPFVYGVFSNSQPPTSDEGVFLLANRYYISQEEQPLFMFANTTEQLSSASSTLGTKQTLVYINNRQDWKESSILLGQNSVDTAYLASPVSIILTGFGNWSERADSILSQNEDVGTIGNATGMLDLSGLTSDGPIRIWFYGTLQGDLRFSALGNSAIISDSSTSAKWYDLNLTSTPSSIPIEFNGTSLSLQSFFIERNAENSASPNFGEVDYSVSNGSSDDISVRLSNKGVSLLTLRDSYDSGWRAQSGSQVLAHAMSSLGFNVFVANVKSTPTIIQVSYAAQSTRIVVFTLFLGFGLIGTLWVIASKRSRNSSSIGQHQPSRGLDAS